MKEIIEKIFQDSIKVKQETLKTNVDQIAQAAQIIIEAYKNGKKVIIFGNGGSAADSQHVAAELIGRFQKERKSLSAIALTTDTSAITALGNDYGYEVIFSRQMEGLATPGDVAIGISTSGNSANVIKGIETAKGIGLKTISLTGCQGGKLAPVSDIKIIVPSKNTARIQESHNCILHSICELVEGTLFP